MGDTVYYTEQETGFGSFGGMGFGNRPGGNMPDMGGEMPDLGGGSRPGGNGGGFPGGQGGFGG